MAGLTKEEFPPLLGPGFHDIGLDGLERLCVLRFPDSVTRPSLMTNLVKIIALLQKEGMRGQVWINGSFVTEKLNPDDSDIVLVMTSAEYLRMSNRQRQFFEWFRDASLSGSHRCDNYAFIKDDSPEGQWQFAYWLRQFGFSRDNKMKGLVVLNLPFLVAA